MRFLCQAIGLLVRGLSLQNDFWFNHLRGIAPAHDHVSYVGALSQRAGSFDALPIADFYLLMVYSFLALHKLQAQDFPVLLVESLRAHVPVSWEVGT